MDVSRQTPIEPLQIRAGDTQSRFFRLVLTDNGVAYSPPDGAMYTIRFENKLHAGWYDKIELPSGESRPAITVSDNVLTCEVAEAATWYNGRLCIMITTDTGFQLALWDIQIQTDFAPADGNPETASYYNANIQTLLERVALYGIAAEIQGTTLVIKAGTEKGGESA